MVKNWNDDDRWDHRRTARGDDRPAVSRTVPTSSAARGEERTAPAGLVPAASVVYGDDLVATTADPERDAANGEPSLMRNLYLILDGSSSMAGEPGGRCFGDAETRLDGTRAALRTFFDHLPGDVNAGLFVFDRAAPRQLVALGPADPTELRAALDAVRPGGRTHLTEAIRFATERLAEQRARQAGYGEFRLLVITDEETRDLRDAAHYATRHGIPIYAVGLCTRTDHPMAAHVYAYDVAGSRVELERALAAALAPPPPLESPTGSEGS